MQRKFLTYSLLFFLPVVAGYLALEHASRQLPSVFKENQRYISETAPSIETLVLGSSQMQGAINPEWLDSPTVNMASGDQHHNTDFKLLQGMMERFPQLKTVVLEVSYSHFELPHNGKDFWKNTLYLNYFEVNCFERTTYFKDRLLYLANPKFFSRRLHQDYLSKEETTNFNAYAFNLNNYEGQFKTLDYDEQRIADMPNFKINREPNLQLFKHNTALFEEMLIFLRAKNLQVILVQAPMYKTYHSKKTPAILNRRDSTVNAVLRKYENVRLLNAENDTINYGVKDFWNQSHLNPKGAEKFTATLNTLLKDLK